VNLNPTYLQRSLLRDRRKLYSCEYQSPEGAIEPSSRLALALPAVYCITTLWLAVLDY